MPRILFGVLFAIVLALQFFSAVAAQTQDWRDRDGDIVTNPLTGERIDPFVWYNADTGLVYLNSLGRNGIQDSENNLTLLGDDIGMVSIGVGFSGLTETNAVLPQFADGIAWADPVLFDGQVTMSGNAIDAAFLPVAAQPIFQLSPRLNRFDFGLDINGMPTDEFRGMFMGVNFAHLQPGATIYSNVPISITNERLFHLADVNRDGEVDCGDVDSISLAAVNGSDDPSLDVNGDGAIDVDDVTRWRFHAEIPMGDANLDGVVDVTDFNTWNASKLIDFQFGWCAGDFSTNGRVDVSDFNLWNQNKFQQQSARTVPEPVSLSWIFIAAFAMWPMKFRSHCVK